MQPKAASGVTIAEVIFQNSLGHHATSLPYVLHAFDRHLHEVCTWKPRRLADPRQLAVL